MFEQIKTQLMKIKMRTVALVIAVLLTFGLIAASAPNLPANAETVVTEPRPRRGPRGGGNRPNRPQRNERPLQPLELDDLFGF